MNTVSIMGEYCIPGFMGYMDPIGPYKNWWACCEAIHANLLCYCVSGEERYLQHYEIARDWAIEHYADREYGEWYGVLSGDGRLIDGGAKATDIKSASTPSEQLISARICPKDRAIRHLKVRK